MNASRSVEGSSRAPDTGEGPSGATVATHDRATAIVERRQGCRFPALSATLTAPGVRPAVRAWPEGSRDADGRSALPMWRELVATEQDRVVCDRKEEPRRDGSRPGDGPNDETRESHDHARRYPSPGRPVSPQRRPSGRPRGYYGVGVWKAKHEVNVGSLWRTAATYDAAFLALVGARYRKEASDTCNAPKTTPLHRYPDMDDLVDHLPYDCRIVGVELDDRACPLDRYVHPERALYLLGAEDHGLSQPVLDRCHEVVSIPTPNPRSINVAVAGSIVIAHRYMDHRARLAALGVAS